MNLGRFWVGHRRTLAFIGIAVSLSVGLSTPAEARRKHRSTYNPPYSEIVVDAKTGKVLEAKNADALRHPASITKVMTLYLLFEQLEQGKVTLHTPLRVSAHAARQSPSKLGLPPGSTIEVEDAIKAVVTKSANDIAVVIAENLAGSEEAFAAQMTRKARALGMTQTVYRNASGLPNDEQVTTARELTLLGRAMQDRFPQYYKYFSTHQFSYDGRTYKNHNNLLGRIEGVDGIKTGFISASGFNILTNVRTGNRHLIAVVMGGRSARLRDRAMASLIADYLPRAYAGARTAPMIVENGAGAREIAVADASPEPAVEVAPVAEAAPPPPARKPLDLNALRPVVASAADAGSTTTPSSGSALRWRKGPQALPQSTQAYAALKSDGGPSTDDKTALLAKIHNGPAAKEAVAPEAREVKTASLEADVPVAKASEPKHAARTVVTGWIIQLGATDDEGKAKAMLESAREKAGKLLAKASPFTEKISHDGDTLYRARFSGFDESDDAQRVCKVLKKRGFACFAARG